MSLQFYSPYMLLCSQNQSGRVRVGPWPHLSLQKAKNKRRVLSEFPFPLLKGKGKNNVCHVE